MKIFLSYKQTDIQENILKTELKLLKSIIEKFKNNVFVYYLENSWKIQANEIINTVKDEINKTDLVIWFINYSKKSEWQLLELWIAKWLNKKILLLVNKKVKSNYFLIYWLNSKILYYENINEIEKILSNYFLWK